MGMWLLTEATGGNKRGHKDIRGGAINQEIPVTSGVIWMKGQPPFRRCTRKAPTVHFAATKNENSCCMCKCGNSNAAYDICSTSGADIAPATSENS